MVHGVDETKARSGIKPSARAAKRKYLYKNHAIKAER
jgi:hypothetical protein